MTNPIRGIVSIVANYGIGKTTFALECGYHPKDIIFINDDVKETGFEKEFSQYIDLVADSKKLKLLELHSHGLDLILNLPRAKVIIWDTWTQFASTFPIYVKAYLGEFRSPNEWSAMGRIKAGEIYQEAYRYEGAVLSELKSKCDLLILTFHLKQHYENNVAIPNRFKPGHDRSIEKYSDLRLWLTHSPNGQVPVGLVLKNISKRSITKQGIKTEQVLPLRIDQCNWQNLLAYWQNPIGNRKPVEGERPSSFELSLIEGTLTPEDKRLYEASLSLIEKQAEQEATEESTTKREQVVAVKKYVAENLNGLPSPVQIKKIKAEIKAGNLAYDGEVTAAILR